jgi:hypothetical protein
MKVKIDILKTSFLSRALLSGMLGIIHVLKELKIISFDKKMYPSYLQSERYVMMELILLEVRNFSAVSLWNVFHMGKLMLRAEDIDLSREGAVEVDDDTLLAIIGWEIEGFEIAEVTGITSSNSYKSFS